MNTSLILFKSIVRSIMDYGSFIYALKEEVQNNKVEKIQHAGVKTALGYRISTPTNVMLIEARIMRSRERADMLARNFLSKVWCYGTEKLKKKLDDLAMAETRYRFKQPRGRINVIIETWRRVKKDKEILDRNDRYRVFDTVFWTLTNGIMTEGEIEKRWAKDPKNKKKIYRKVKEKDVLRNDNII